MATELPQDANATAHLRITWERLLDRFLEAQSRGVAAQPAQVVRVVAGERDDRPARVSPEVEALLDASFGRRPSGQRTRVGATDGLAGPHGDEATAVVRGSPLGSPKPVVSVVDLGHAPGIRLAAIGVIALGESPVGATKDEPISPGVDLQHGVRVPFRVCQFEPLGYSLALPTQPGVNVDSRV
jgi:hypothetical protein